MEVVALNGLRCRCRAVPSGRRPGASEWPYYYEVVASFVDPRGDLQCAVINRTGGTNVVRFTELEFEPRKE